MVKTSTNFWMEVTVETLYTTTIFIQGHPRKWKHSIYIWLFLEDISLHASIYETLFNHSNSLWRLLLNRGML